MIKSAAEKKADAIRAFKQFERPVVGAFDQWDDHHVAIGAPKVMAAIRAVSRQITSIPLAVMAGFRRFG